MRKLFYCCAALLLILISAEAADAGRDAECRNCDRYSKARTRALRPATSVLGCVHFTLPTEAGGRVVLNVWKDDRLIIEDAKVVTTREGQFCYPKARWRPDPSAKYKVYFCSVHSVTLTGRQIAPITSQGRGTKPEAYACLRGIAGCGGTDNVAIRIDADLK